MNSKQALNKTSRANETELAEMLTVGIGAPASHDDVEKVRAWLAANPGELSYFGELATQASAKVVECATTWVVERETVAARMRKLRDDLGYESSNILEQMAITQVVLNWARLYFLENNLSNATKESHRPESAHYWDRRVTMAQGRYNQALTTLAKLRKLKLPDITAIQAQVAYVNASDGPVEMQAKRLLSTGETK